jgi:hypothetical protein
MCINIEKELVKYTQNSACFSLDGATKCGSDCKLWRVFFGAAILQRQYFAVTRRPPLVEGAELLFFRQIPAHLQ